VEWLLELAKASSDCWGCMIVLGVPGQPIQLGPAEAASKTGKTLAEFEVE